ncbi:MAG: PhoH family protein [Clostridia bacterium]|nr:PhoH family protein [Clostridia bacterium]
MVEFGSAEQMQVIFGNLDSNVRFLENETGTVISQRDGNAYISGPMNGAMTVKNVLEELKKAYSDREYIDEAKISYLLDLARAGEEIAAVENMEDVVAITYRGKPVKTKTLGQKRYMEAIDKNTVVFAIGPAGTGKTYLAMAKAVVALKNKQVSRIILTRPAVEAGEKLGFLPGDLQSKVDPYLRPLYDALYEFMGPDAYHKLIESGVIEVAPLAYMRGRTLSDSYIILDEAQNCSIEQLKMFLTRFGEGSKVVVTGDITQIDLAEERKSGLNRITRILSEVDGVERIELTSRDVVRHKLVKDIVKAFEKYDRTYNKDNQR